MQHNLELKYSISRARDTDGYNVVTLVDHGKKYRAMGGGYDMIGTVFADWLKSNYLSLIVEKICPDSVRNLDGTTTDFLEAGFYGFSIWHDEEGVHYALDGACGLECMVKIARACGMEVTRVHSGRILTNFIVTL